MPYRALFILLVLTVSKASTAATITQKCYLDLQQVITTPYCANDDCTIENYETG